MSRRTLGGASLAAALMCLGLAPLVGPADAANCEVEWSDVEKDAKPIGAGTPDAAYNANLDIVGSSIETDGDNLVARVKVAKLNTANATGAGDYFGVALTLGSEIVTIRAFRDATNSKTADVVSNVTKEVGAAAATFDGASNTVTIVAPKPSVEKATGKPMGGKETTKLTSYASMQVAQNELFLYDTAKEDSKSYAVGQSCGGSDEPTDEPTEEPTEQPTTPPPGPGDLPMPTPGCTTLSDPQGDAADKVTAAPGVVVPVGEADAGLDVTDVTLRTTTEKLFVYIKVAKLAAEPSNMGDRFEVGFQGPDTGTIQLYAARASQRGKTAQMADAAGGTPARLKVAKTIDVARSMVILEVERGGLHADIPGKSPWDDGAVLTSLTVATRSYLGPSLATARQYDFTPSGTYTLGDNACFGPVASKLTNVGLKTVQFGDALELSAKLTSGTDSPVAGKSVKFALGGQNYTATTDEDGVASKTVTPALTAGSYSLVASFAGDTGFKASTVTTPIAVTPEVTEITLTVKKSGTRRTVTAKVLDDDGKVVVGQVVTWFINGKKATAPKTNSSGIVTLTTAKAGQTVKAELGAVTGKYATSKAEQKLT